MAKLDNKLAVYKDAHRRGGADLGDILRGVMVKKEQVAALVDDKRPHVDRTKRPHETVFFNPANLRYSAAYAQQKMATLKHDPALDAVAARMQQQPASAPRMIFWELQAELLKLKAAAKEIGWHIDGAFLKPIRKDSVRTSYDNYMQGLRNRGFRQLGAGAFGTVFVHPKRSDRVVKVSRDANCVWPHYVQWANSLKVNMGPKLYSLKFHAGFYVAVMERVDTDDHSKRHVSGPFSEYRYSNKNMCSNDTLAGFKKNAGIHWCNKRWPHMIAYLRLLEKRSMSGDLHHGNWGVREDGSVCIFDPTTTVPRDIKSRFPKQRVRTYE